MGVSPLIGAFLALSLTPVIIYVILFLYYEFYLDLLRKKAAEELQFNKLTLNEKTNTEDCEEILRSSAVQLAKNIRSGRWTSEMCVSVFIARQRQVNSVINAIVEDRHLAAIEEAREVDEHLSKLRKTWPALDEDGLSDEAVPTFYGVPISIKGNFAVSGMSQTSGLVSRRDLRAEKDCPAVARLRNAGFIVLSLTNTSELCMWYESSNRLHGRTSNPYDIRRIVGGSSGGEAAMIAAAGAPCGLGSDVGGSIRMPAFFNGIFGHKPSSYVVPNLGQHPNTDTVSSTRCLSTGPFSRHSEDIFPMLRILAGSHDSDPFATDKVILQDPRSVVVPNLKIYTAHVVGKAFEVKRVSADLKTKQEEVAEYLRSTGCVVEKCEFAAFHNALDLWSAVMGTGKKSFRESMEDGGKINLPLEGLRWCLGLSAHTLPALGLSVLEQMTKLSPEKLDKQLKLCAELKKEVCNKLRNNGVLLFPSHSSVAPFHNAPLLPHRITSFIYCAIFNALELPVTQVPLGLDRNGIPLGIQVVAAHGNDHLTIAVARELEKGFGGWRSVY